MMNRIQHPIGVHVCDEGSHIYRWLSPVLSGVKYDPYWRLDVGHSNVQCQKEHRL